MAFYLQGIEINAKLFSIKHGLEILQTAVDTVQIVHQLHPDKHVTINLIKNFLFNYSDPPVSNVSSFTLITAFI